MEESLCVVRRPTQRNLKKRGSKKLSATYFDKENQVEKTCVVCGKTFICNNSMAVRTRKYCSEACKLVARKQRANERKKVSVTTPGWKDLEVEINNPKKPSEVKPVEKPVSKHRPKKEMTATDISREAKRLGLTYSQYVAKYLT